MGDPDPADELLRLETTKANGGPASSCAGERERALCEGAKGLRSRPGPSTDGLEAVGSVSCLILPKMVFLSVITK